MDTPANRIIAEAAMTMTVCDRQGRQLGLRRISALDRLRLFKAIGPDLAQNIPYLGLALLALSVTSIDDVPLPPPVTEGQLEAIVVRLGDDGLAAVGDVLAESEGKAEEFTASGNSAGTPI